MSKPIHTARCSFVLSMILTSALVPFSGGIALASAETSGVKSLAADITPAQLTPEQRKTYDHIASDPAAASAYLSSVAYLRLCQRVVAKSSPALKLTDIPDDYDDANFTQAEKDAVDKGTTLRFAAMLAEPIPGTSPSTAPAVAYSSTSATLAILTPAQLTPRERKTYNRIASNSVAARRYLTTRSFVKVSQNVVAKSVPALSLPDLPGDFDEKYLSPADMDLVDKASKLRFAAMITQPIRQN